MLSPTHLRLRDWILAYQAEHGTRPYYKEIHEGLGLAIGAVSRYVRELEQAGELVLIYAAPRPKSNSQVQRASEPNTTRFPG